MDGDPGQYLYKYAEEDYFQERLFIIKVQVILI